MLRAGIAMACAVVWAGSAQAQSWPTRPMTLVVPYAAGGPVDTLGRILAARLSEILGQQVVVETLAGAGGCGSRGQSLNRPNAAGLQPKRA